MAQRVEEYNLPEGKLFATAMGVRTDGFICFDYMVKVGTPADTEAIRVR
jgi:hypothetical protein